MADKKDFKKAGVDLLFSASDEQQETPGTADNTNKEKKKKTNKYANILENIKKPDELPGANVTFYLEKEIIEAILNTSKEMNVSRSKLVNKILKQVLLGDD